MEPRWSGSVLEGTKINGWLEGEGRCVLPNGVIYEGQFKEGNFHGKGEFPTAVGLTISLQNTVNAVYGMARSWPGPLKASERFLENYIDGTAGRDGRAAWRHAVNTQSHPAVC